MKFLIAILLTSSIFAQKEYKIDNIYDRASDKVYIKKFSDELVNGDVYQMFGNEKVILEFMILFDTMEEGVCTIHFFS